MKGNAKYITYCIIYTIIALILGTMCVWQKVTGYYALSELLLIVMFIAVLAGDVWAICSIKKNNKKKDTN